MKGDNDLFIVFAVLCGFVAFSLPLLVHDLGVVDLRPSRSGGDVQNQMPPPPPYAYPQENFDDDAHKFRSAIQDGDLVEAERLYAASLAEDPPVDLANKQHWHGSTPLFEAARSGQLKAAEWLLKKGVSADQSNDWGDSPVNEAGSMGHWDVVWFLADHGANLTRHADANSHGSLALSAVRHRNSDALAELQKRGHDLNARHWNGNTVLHEAARSGDTDMLTWLLNHTDIGIDETNDSGEPALCEAATMGHTDAMWVLIHRNASVGAPGSHTASALFQSAVRHAHVDMLTLL